MDWGICSAPPALAAGGRFTVTPGRAGDSGCTSWRGNPFEPLIPEPWPPDASSPEWHGACRRILNAFEVHVGTALREAGLPSLKSSRLKLVHPADETLLEAVRSIHNGETPEDYPLPRVWRYECEWVPVWIIELTA